jgi:hypothetical protein
MTHWNVTRPVKAISELKASDIGSGTVLSGAEPLRVTLSSSGGHVELVVASKTHGAFFFAASVTAAKRCFKRAVADVLAPIAASCGVRDSPLPLLLMAAADSPVAAYWSIGDDAGDVLGFVPLRAATATHNVAAAPLLVVDAPLLCLATDVDRNALLPADPLLDDLFTKLLGSIELLVHQLARHWKLVALPPGVSAAPKTPDEAAATVRAAFRWAPADHCVAAQVLLERDGAAPARLAAIAYAATGGRTRVQAVLLCVSFGDLAAGDAATRRPRLEQRVDAVLAALQKLIIATCPSHAVYNPLLAPRAESLAAAEPAVDTRLLATAVALALRAHNIELEL